MIGLTGWFCKIFRRHQAPEKSDANQEACKCNAEIVNDHHIIEKRAAVIPIESICNKCRDQSNKNQWVQQFSESKDLREEAD